MALRCRRLCGTASPFSKGLAVSISALRLEPFRAERRYRVVGQNKPFRNRESTSIRPNGDQAVHGDVMQCRCRVGFFEVRCVPPSGSALDALRRRACNDAW